MAEFITTSDQTIFDLSIQLYGDSSHAVQILKDNPAIGSVTDNIVAGSVIFYSDSVGNAVVNFFRTNVTTGTGNPETGRGFDLGFDLYGFK